MIHSIRALALTSFTVSCVGALCLLVGRFATSYSAITQGAASTQSVDRSSNSSTIASIRWQTLNKELLRSLVDQQTLKELRIVMSTRDGTPILREIAKLEQLESLSLLEVPLDDDELACLANMRQLKSLELSQTGITGKGLSYLRGLPLQHLTIRELDLAENGLQDVQSLTELESLNLVIPGFHVSNLPSLAGLSKLNSVSITKGLFSFRNYGGLQCLVGAGSIRELVLAGQNFNDRSLQVVGQLMHLERVEIEKSVVSDEGIHCLAGLHQLKSIKIEGLDRISEQSLAGLVERSDQSPIPPTRG